MRQSAQLKPAFTNFIRKLFTRQTSNYYIVFGRRETGKTDFALLLFEVLYELGIIKHFATNIKIYDSDPIQITEIDNLDDLEFWAKTLRGSKLFGFDEIGTTVPRRSPMSRLNVKLITKFQLLRKYKLNIIAITQDESYTDNAILGAQVLDGIFIKPFLGEPKKSQKLALYQDLLTNETQPFENIPATSIKFDTWFPAPFKEHGPLKKPGFKDRDLEILWDWSHGKTAKDLDVSHMKIHRLSTKFVKEVLEREHKA